MTCQFGSLPRSPLARPAGARCVWISCRAVNHTDNRLDLRRLKIADHACAHQYVKIAVGNAIGDTNLKVASLTLKPLQEVHRFAQLG